MRIGHYLPLRGNRASNVLSMLQETAHVAYGTKTSQNRDHGHLTQYIL